MSQATNIVAPMRSPAGELPVGSISAFAGPLNPPGTISSSSGFLPTPVQIEAWGWMACDGRSLPAQDYPELFAMIGYIYGGSGGNFCVPDYRGYFLRGNGAGTQVDPGIDKRTPPNGADDSFDGVGSVQSCAVEAHAHNNGSATFSASAGATSLSGFGAGITQTSGGPAPMQGQPNPVQVSVFETRPLNVAVNYIIKFTYGWK